MIDEKLFCEAVSKSDQEVSLEIYTMNEIGLYFFDMQIRVQERFDKEADGSLRFEVFVPRMELRNYILQVEEDLRQEKEDIKEQKAIVAKFRHMLRESVVGNKIYIGDFQNQYEAQSRVYLENSHIDSPKGLVLNPVLSPTREIIGKRLDYLYEFFVDRRQFEEYIAALEEIIADNCVDYKRIQYFLEVIKAIENKIGG